jgi:hypothetical protein
MKIERKGATIVDDTDRDVGLSIGQVDRFVGRQDLHFDFGVKPSKLSEVRHEQVCCQCRRQCYPQQPPYTLVAPKHARRKMIRRRLHPLSEFKNLLPRIGQPITGG